MIKLSHYFLGIVKIACKRYEFILLAAEEMLEAIDCPVEIIATQLTASKKPTRISAPKIRSLPLFEDAEKILSQVREQMAMN